MCKAVQTQFADALEIITLKHTIGDGRRGLIGF
jgi:hypothetical protein